MKKLKVLLIVLIAINIILASVLVIDTQLFEAPEIAVDIEVLDVNSEEITLGTNIEVENPNGFDVTISDLKIDSKTKDGESIGNIIIKGGKISSSSKKSFDSIDKLSFKNDNFDTIENTISTTIGINILGFITKTIPLKITAHASFEKILADLDSPDIDINFAFDDVSIKGINFSTSLDIYNPNSFEINVNRILFDVLTDNNSNVGSLEIYGNTIKPNSSEVFSSKGTLEFEALDAEVLIINVSGIVGAKIAGINKNVSFSADATFNIPEIKSFIFENESIDVSLPVQFRFTASGLMATVGLKIYNPSEVDIIAKNLVCNISRLDDGEMSLLAQKEMDSCEIGHEKTVCIKTQMRIPYLTYLFSGSGKLLPEWIILNIQGDFSIAGTRQAFPLSISAYIDPHFIRNSDFAVHES